MPPGSHANSDSDLESVISFKTAPKPRRSSIGPKYFCGIEGCGKSFKRQDHLDRHEYHHTGIKKHYCVYEDCDKVYSILTHLKRHIRTTHERVCPPEKKVPCPLPGCLKMFQTNTNMQRHIREVHDNPKIYPCSYCSEKFTQKLKMRRHEIQKHTGEYPYTCEKCSRGFYQQWQHDSHVPTCKLYTCLDCDTKFDKWTNYIKHCKEEHHGRKYYQCEHCERVYPKPSELKKHMAAKHMEEELKMVFKCEYCERSYTYERNLRQHITIAHKGKRFECTVAGCARVFSSSQNLGKHLERDQCTLATESKESKAKKRKKSSGSRKKRKDAGQSIMSNLSKLSGIAVDKNMDKLLREREELALEIAGSMLAKDQSESNFESEDDLPLAKLAKFNESDCLENLVTAVLTDAII